MITTTNTEQRTEALVAEATEAIDAALAVVRQQRGLSADIAEVLSGAATVMRRVAEHDLESAEMELLAVNKRLARI